VKHPTHRRRWLPVEDQILRRIYPRFGLSVSADVLGRSKASVTRRRRTIGIVAWAP